MKLYNLFVIAPFALLFASCGSISDVKPTESFSSKKFAKVVVRDFKYTEEEGEDGIHSTTDFPDKICKGITSKKAFTSVMRNSKPSSGTLVIEGEVTKYVEGNPMLRAMVGMGAGSSYFDANVRFVDGGTGKVIGNLTAGKNSWVLGGGLAAGQTAKGFMLGAAEKVSVESIKFSNIAPKQ
jgi:Domain of unknown function (DUF4410)